MKRCLMLFSTLAMLLAMFSCSRQMSTEPQEEARPLICFGEDKIALPDGEFQYQQSISCEQSEPGMEYAFRVHTLSGKLPEGYTVNADNWLLFGEDIWTSNPSLNMVFESTAGKLNDLITSVELQILDADGQITRFDSPFKSNRIIGSRIGVNFGSGQAVSCGLVFTLQELVGDIFVEGMYADHFMYRLNIVNGSMQVVTPGTWYSSMNMADVRKVILNTGTTPALTPTPANHFTQFECYVVSRQGIEEATHQSVYFVAQSGFRPQAMIYPETVAGLGDKHYAITDSDPMISHELIPSNTDHKNRRLWLGNNCKEAIWSSDFRLYLRWGYYGQFGGTTSSGQVVVTNSPWDQELGLCLDANSLENYYSRIEYFDLRWDGAPFPTQSYFVNPRLVVHNDGSIWLRIKNFDDRARHHTFAGLAQGMHQLEVCVIDLQNVISDPAVQNINLVPFKDYGSRSGILIVDDSVNSSSYSPEIYVDDFYASVVPNTWGAVDVVEINPTNPDQLVISPVVMQNYLALLWHSDNPTHSSNMHYSMDALEIYLSNAGKMVVSGTNKLTNTFAEMGISNTFLADHFGMSSSSQYGYLSSSFIQNNFFVQADGISIYPDINLDLSEPFNNLISFRQGLSCVTYFNANPNLEMLYQFGCKPVNWPAYPPTQEQYDLYSSTYVGYKKIHGASEVVVFGMPLSYMEQADVDAALQEVFFYMLAIIDRKGRGI